MATSGTPHEGVDNILVAAYTGLVLVLYTNVGDELDRDTVFADLVEPANEDDVGADNGYAAISLSGTWSSTGSLITYDHGTPDNPKFQNTGTSGVWDAATGSAITDGTYVFHFKDFGTPIVVTLGATLEIDISSAVS